MLEVWQKKLGVICHNPKRADVYCIVFRDY